MIYVLASLWDLVKWLRWPGQQIFAGRVAPTTGGARGMHVYANEYPRFGRKKKLV
jgi:hypothetical protein